MNESVKIIVAFALGFFVCFFSLHGEMVIGNFLNKFQKFLRKRARSRG